MKQFPPLSTPITAITAITAMLLLGLAGTARAAVIYDLSTADISDPGQNTYVAVAGTGGNGSFTGSSLPSNLFFSRSGGVNAFGYFVGKYTAQTLSNEGDKLTLSFTATVNNLAQATRALRLGLYDVGTATTGASSTYTPTTGYQVDQGNSIRQRNATDPTIFTTSATPSLGGSGANLAWDISNGSSITGTFSLERLAGGDIRITSDIDGFSETVTDTTSPYTTFNAFSFFIVSDGTNAPSINFTSLSVDFTPVPEPSAPLLLLLGASGLLLVRRRKSRSIRPTSTAVR